MIRDQTMRHHRRRRRSKAVIHVHVRPGENKSIIDHRAKKAQRIPKKTMHITPYQQPIVTTESSIQHSSKVHSLLVTGSEEKSQSRFPQKVRIFSTRKAIERSKLSCIY